MSKKIVALFAIFAFLAVIGGAVLRAADANSWTGEVIDVACNSAKGAHGATHAECGAACIKNGLPVGLLVGDTTYLLVSSDHKPLNATLVDHVGHTITVSGEKFETKGANVIVVKDWKMAS
jgi:hypothetical protein